MNRKQRRLAQKQGRPVKKDPVYNVKKNDLMQYAEKAANNLRQQAIDAAFITTLAIPIYVLRHKYGFGKKRLTELMDHVLFQYSCIDTDHVSLEDMRKLILDETGVEVWDSENIKRLKDKEWHIDARRT